WRRPWLSATSPCPGAWVSWSSWRSRTSSTGPRSKPKTRREGRVHRDPRGREDDALLRPGRAPEAPGRERGRGQGGGEALPAAHQPQDLARRPDLDPDDPGGGGDPLREPAPGRDLRPQRARQLRLHGPGLRPAEGDRAVRGPLDEDLRPALQGADVRRDGLRGRRARYRRVLHA